MTDIYVRHLIRVRRAKGEKQNPLLLVDDNGTVSHWFKRMIHAMRRIRHVERWHRGLHPGYDGKIRYFLDKHPEYDAYWIEIPFDKIDDKWRYRYPYLADQDEFWLVSMVKISGWNRPFKLLDEEVWVWE